MIKNYLKLETSIKKGLTYFIIFTCGIFISNAQSTEGGCTDPVVSATSGPGTICEGETATLTATHDGEEVNWFDAATGGTLVGTGSPFITDPLTETTSFWAEAFNTGGAGTPITGGARVAPTNTSNSAVVAATSPWGLAFNADVDFTINTVDVYLASNSPGTVVIQLKDSGLNILEEETIAVPAGNSSSPVQHTLNLDFFVPTGLDYNLVAESSPNMVREFSSGHPGFPYDIGTAGTVTNGTINDDDTNSGVYYFFYNWTVTPGEVCTSARVEEVVNVTVTPLPVGDSNQTFLPGETLADLDVTGVDLTWYSDAAGTNEIPDTTPLVDGTTYYVSQTDNSCESQLLAITVSEIGGGCTDPVVSATGGPGTICEGETATLTATHDGEEVNWFDAATGGTLVGTGSPFITDPLTETTSFWAEAFNTGGAGTPITGGARVAPTNTTNSAVVPVTSPWGLAFNADVDFTINTVDVYLASNSPGTVVMQLKDSGLNILEEETIAVPAGNSSSPVQHTLNLNFFVPAGLDYNLVAESSPNMVREFSSGHPGFPYPIGTAGTVINGTINDNDTNAGVYYFFYNWTVTPGEVCTSARVEEVVNVTVTPLPVGDSNQTFLPGETLADLDVTGVNLTWYSDAAGTNEIPDTTPLVDGTTYYVSQTDNSCESQLLAITVSEILGIEDGSLTELTFYPNPVSETLHINNAMPILSVEVYNVMGQLVSKGSFEETNIQIEMSTFSSGPYFVKVGTETGSATFKVIKE